MCHSCLHWHQQSIGIVKPWSFISNTAWDVEHIHAVPCSQSQLRMSIPSAIYYETYVCKTFCGMSNTVPCMLPCSVLCMCSVVCTHCTCAILVFLGRPYIVFRNRFLCGFMFVYIILYNRYISVKMAAPWGTLNLLSFHSLCLHLRSHLNKWDVF